VGGGSKNGHHSKLLSLSPDKKRGKQQGITNMVALPIDKMLYIYLLYPHSKTPKKSIPV
jgi:hypothetical protein